MAMESLCDWLQVYYCLKQAAAFAALLSMCPLLPESALKQLPTIAHDCLLSSLTAFALDPRNAQLRD